MNRRGFITALAALVPASLLPAPKPEPMREWTASGTTLVVHPNHEETMRKILAENHYGKSPMELVEESTARMVDEMSALGESCGNSYNFLKTREASKIMARVDRNFLNRKL